MADARGLAAAVAAVALAAGCGGDDPRPADREPRPASSPQSMPGPGVDVTTSPAPTPTATATPAPEEQPGGAGDESGGPRLEFRVEHGSIRPERVRTPAWVRTGFVLSGRRVGPEQVELVGEGGPVDLAPDGPGAFHAALRPGEYELRVEGAGAATVVAE